MITIDHIGQALEATRRTQQQTQAVLAEKAGWQQHVWSRLHSGHNMTMESFLHACRALRVSPTAVLAVAERMAIEEDKKSSAILEKSLTNPESIR